MRLATLQRNTQTELAGSIAMRCAVNKILPFAFLWLSLVAEASVDDAEAFLESTYAPDRPGASVIIMRDGEEFAARATTAFQAHYPVPGSEE